MDAAGGTLSASSASGQRVRAYARRYIDEPNVSCTRTHAYRCANAEWHTGTSVRQHGQEHSRDLFRAF
jgi:hypothetical protein